MKNIKISGLVKLMNRAREHMGTGIPASQAPAFRRMVEDAVAFVEGVCRREGISPDDLPAPTRRAYCYLKDLDLENLPLLNDDQPGSLGGIRISNVVSSCRAFQRELSQWARGGAENAGKDIEMPSDLALLHGRMSDLASLIDRICEEMGGSPSRLPGPTLRAYQWLKFLNEETNFLGHVHALRGAYGVWGEGEIEFYNIAGIYRSRIRGGVPHLVANEAFIGAPPPVIKALISAAVNRAGSESRATIRRYADSDEFSEIVADLELIGTQTGEMFRGVYYDLGEVFSRVNECYFKGRLDRPVLTWNRTITHAKFGHYAPASDTVMISIALDSRHTPQYVIDHVMYHELLHKALGIRVVNGRRMAHTAEFKARERKFEGFQDAQEYLKALSTELRSS